MQIFLTYLRLELKRALRNIPYFLAGAVVLAVFAGAIAFSAGRILYSDHAVGKIPVGVVISEKDGTSKKLVSMISSLESVSSLCEFSYVDEEEGRRQLRNGEIYALLLVPEGMVQGIVDGTNRPAVVVFPENAGLESAVFRELTDAGMEILKTGQAAVYGTDELCLEMGKDAEIPVAEREINSLYMKYALNRSVYFRTEEVSAVGDIGTAAFYGISAAVFLLMFLGIPAAGFLRPLSGVMGKKLFLMGLGRARRLLARTVSLTLIFACVTAVPFFVSFYAGLLESGLFSIPVWILVCAAAAVWTVFIYELAGSTFAGICALFLTGTVFIFMAGGLVPSVFLPEAVQELGKLTPAYFFMDAVRWMVAGGNAASVAKLAAGGVIVFFIAAGLRRDYE